MWGGRWSRLPGNAEARSLPSSHPTTDTHQIFPLILCKQVPLTHGMFSLMEFLRSRYRQVWLLFNSFWGGTMQMRENLICKRMGWIYSLNRNCIFIDYFLALRPLTLKTPWCWPHTNVSMFMQGATKCPDHSLGTQLYQFTVRGLCSEGDRAVLQGIKTESQDLLEKS